MIKRARLFFVLAVLVAAGILVANFPAGSIMAERSAVRADAVRLANLRSETSALAAQVKALHHAATVGQIAHEEYGLIEPGEQSVVVLPGSAKKPSNTTANPLADNPIPSSDLLPSDSILDSGVTPQRAVHQTRGFWHRFMGSLEFWHSLF